MSSEPDQAKAFLEYLKENDEERALLQKAFEEMLVAAGALAGYHFSTHDLKVSLKATDVVGGGWHI